MKKKRFQVGNDYYDIPDNEVGAFLADNPKAVEVKYYDINGSKYNIPIKEVDSFETDMGLKKKDWVSDIFGKVSKTTGTTPQSTTASVGGMAGSVSSKVAAQPKNNPVRQLSEQEKTQQHLDNLKRFQSSTSFAVDPEVDPVMAEYAPVISAIGEHKKMPLSDNTRLAQSKIPSFQERNNLLIKKKQIENIRVPNVQTAELVLGKLIDKSKLVRRTDKPIDMMQGDELFNYTPESIREASKGNMTAEIAANQYIDTKQIEEDLNSSLNLEEAAIKTALRKQNKTADQINVLKGNIPDAMKGNLMMDFLQNENVAELASNSAELTSEMRGMIHDFPDKYPNAAIRIIADMVSKKREDKGINSGILNNPSVSKTTELVNELVEEGKLPANYKFFFEQPEVAFAVNSKIKTPGLVENFGQGLEQGISGIGKTVADLTQVRKIYSSKEDRMFNALKKQYEDFQFKPKGLFHQITTHGGNITGQVLPMMGGGAALRAGNIIKGANASNAIMAGLQTFGENRDQALIDLPKANEATQLGYATINTGIEVALSNVFNDAKFAKQLMRAGAPEIKSIIGRFTAKEITEAAAKEEVETLFSRLISKGASFGKGVIKSGTKEANEETGTYILQKANEQVFGGEKQSFSDVMDNAFDIWTTTFLGSSLLGIGGGVIEARKNPEMSKVVFEMASNPDKYIDIIEGEAAIDPEYAKDAKEKIANLQYAAQVKSELDNRGISDKNKAKFLLNSLSEKILKEKVDTIPDATLRKEGEKQLTELEVEKDILLNPETNNTDIVKEFFENDLLSKGDMMLLSDENGKFSPSKVGDYLKFVAQQSNDLDPDFKPQSIKGKGKQDIPDAILEIANERWKKEIEAAQPKEEIKLEEPPIQPTIDQDRVLEIEPQEDVEQPQTQETTSTGLSRGDEKGISFDRKQQNEAYSGITDVENNEPKKSIGEYISTLFGVKNSGNGASEYYNTERKINGRDVVVRVSDHSHLEGNKRRENDYTVSIVVNGDKPEGLTVNKDYAELNVKASNKNVEDKIGELYDHFDEIEKNAKSLSSNTQSKTREASTIPTVTKVQEVGDWSKDVESTAKALRRVQDLNADAINRILEDFEGDYSIRSLAKEIVDANKTPFIRATKDEIARVKAAKTPKEVLQIILNTTKDPNLKMLADVLIKNIGKAPFLEFKIGLPIDPYGYPVADALGSYGGGKINVSERVFWQRTNNYISDGLENGYKTILHEFIHAFTIDAYRKPKTQSEFEFKKYIDKIYSELKNNSAFKESYGFKNPTEFIAEIMTNPEFRMSAPIYKSGVLDKIIEYIAKIFGYTKDKDAATDLRYEKVKDAFGFILNKIPSIRAGKGKEIYYEIPDVLKRLANAYHKAKLDGLNPKLVKAVEDLLADKPQPTVTTKEQTPETKQEEVIDVSEPPVQPPPPSTPIEETGGVYVEHPKTELSFKGLQNVANEFGLEDVKSRDRKSDIQTYQNARNTINEWAEKGQYSKNVEKLLKGVENHEMSLTDEQRVILQQHLANESKKLRDIKDKNSPEWDEQFKVVKRLKDVGEMARQEAGAALRIPIGMGSHPIQDYADAMVAMAEASGVDFLTDKQKQEVEQIISNYEEKSRLADEKLAAAEAKLAEIEAQKEINRAKGKRTKIKRDYNTERKDIINDIKAKLKTIRNEQQSTILPYARELFAIAPDVAKLVKSYIDEGLTELNDIVERLHDYLKDEIKDITKKDVNDLIRGAYNEKKLTRSELAKKYQLVKKEAELVDKLDRVLAGEIPVSETKRVQENKRLKELRDEIKSIVGMESELLKKADAAINERVKANAKLEKELSKAEKSYKSPGERKLQSEINRLKKETEAIQEKIRNGDFEKEEKAVSWVESTDLKKAYPKLYNEALDAIHAKEDAKLQFDIALLKKQKQNRSTGKKIIDWGAAFISTTKALKAGIDLSGIGIQNIVAMVSHPRSAMKALPRSFKDMVSEKSFSRWLTQIHNSEIWDLMQKSGLDITDPKSLQEQNREDIFSNNLLNKDILIKGKRYNIGKYITRPFERAFTSVGNVMRANMFTNISQRMMEQGKTFESHPQEFKDLAKVLNTETGRGKLHEQIQRSNRFWTTILWSPRLMASRLNMIGLSDLASPVTGKGYYAGLTPEMRKMAIADMAKFIGTGTALLFIAGASGSEVDDDPQSPTFGTFKIGDKRYNAWGGFTPYVKTVYQAATGKRNINGNIKPVNPLKVLGNFFRSRLTPLAGSGVNVVSGKDFSGEPTDAESEISQLAVPLSLNSIFESVKKDGWIGLVNGGIPSIIGIGVSDERDYQKKEKDSEITIKDETGKKIKISGEGIKEYNEKWPKKYEELISGAKNGTEPIWLDVNGDVKISIENTPLKQRAYLTPVEYKDLAAKQVKKLESEMAEKARREVKKLLFNDQTYLEKNDEQNE